MQSIKEIYKIGKGPSSSHTIGPERICKFIKEKYGDGYSYKVILYGSLAYTGKGHGTDKVVREVLGENTEIIFDKTKKKLPHPNTMEIKLSSGGKEVRSIIAESIGGGDYKIDGEDYVPPKQVYNLSTFNDIKKYVKENNLRLSEYVYLTEPDLKEYLKTVWDCMKSSVEEGLKADGILDGGLFVERKAKVLYNKDKEFDENRLISSYALAVAEQNAGNGVVVTAPTCGASGVLPSVMYYFYKDKKIPESKIIDGLAVAGLIGDIVKTNASVSGAECGCQAEIGTACSMTAGAICEVFSLSVDEIECAAEVGLEHNLGLTCDPVGGLVQMPCIERNVMAALRAVASYGIAKYLADMRKISFDTIVKTMYETGKDLREKYKETANGGMAKYFVGE